jgi:hypothetical protein
MPRKARKTGSRKQSKRPAQRTRKKVRRPAVLRKLIQKGMAPSLAEKIANQPAKKK